MPEAEFGNELVPIETQYRGHRFRSRLEARWAVAFDSLGWDWQYEVEGYELRGGRYLPDFCIRLADGTQRWWEIKPERERARRTSTRSVIELRWLDLVVATGQVLVVAHGMPAPGTIDWDVWTLEPVKGEAGRGDGVQLTTRGYGVVAEVAGLGATWDDALRAGRSARFEHDERDAMQRAAGGR